MNYPADVSEFPSIAHMNRPQKRALILRDQLKFLDTKHLDTFLTGIGDPEPPNYKVVKGRLHPPFSEVRLREGATRLDLGNVLFAEDHCERTSRVHFMIEQGKCEMSESSALPERDDDLNSVPIHVFIARQMISLFVKKYEAIDTRKRSLNELRQVARGALNQQKIQISPGKTLEKLNLETERDGRSGNGDSRKRNVGDLVTKHVANKRPRIGLDDISSTAKSAIFNSIPEQVKIDLFNSIVKTALPNFDDLMTAAWNVVYVHKNVGSEDRELYKSITTLEKVLLKFAAFHRKAKTKTETHEQTPREQSLSHNTPRRVDSGSGSVINPAGACSEEVQNRPQVHIAQLAHNAQLSRNDQLGQTDEESTDEAVVRDDAHNRRNDSRNDRYPVEYEARNELSTGQRSQEEQEEAAIVRRVEKLREQMAYAKNLSSGGATLHSQESSPRHVAADEGIGYYDNEQPQRTHDTPREQQHQQRPFNSQREHPSIPHNPRKNLPQDQHYASTSQKANRPADKPACEPDHQIYTDGLNEYFEDAEQKSHVADVKKAARPAPGIFLGHSKLGAPKVPPNAMGTAPVAPMMHTGKQSGGERRGRPMP